MLSQTDFGKQPQKLRYFFNPIFRLRILGVNKGNVFKFIVVK